MTDVGLAKKRLLRAMLKRSGLSQAAFGRLIGAEPLTVNRWLADPTTRAGALAVPKYALLVLKLYCDLGPRAREDLAAETAHW